MQKYSYESFKDYYRETNNKKHRKAETQRADINKHLDKLGAQGDYPSLAIIENLADILANDQDESEAWGLMFLLRNAIELYDHDKREPEDKQLGLVEEIARTLNFNLGLKKTKK